jgi:uncharacterized membrane protein YozB (DUF420 family)
MISPCKLKNKKLNRKFVNVLFYDNMSLLIINIGMTISILCFYIGYFFRIKNNQLHRRINFIGVIANLGTAIFLLTHKYILDGIEGAGIYPRVQIEIVHIHRAFATLSLILMLAMAFTGIIHKKEIHKKIHYFFFPIYTLVYISGLFIFGSR